MYTGITQGMFPVTDVKRRPGLITIKVKLSDKLIKNLKIGASISVDGVCLTVTAIDNLIVSFDIINETANKTTLGNIQNNQQVSIERSAVFGDEIGGHFISGHIYGMGEIIARNISAENLQLMIRCSKEAMQFIFEKGFIGVNGSSLTINAVDLEQCTFAIDLIPHTIAVTDFLNKRVGDKVNLEIDAHTLCIVETIKRLKINA